MRVNFRFLNKDIKGEIEVDPEMPIRELYFKALDYKFIPIIKNGVWTIRLNGILQIFIYFVNINHFVLLNYGHNNIGELFAINDVNFISFEYHSSPEEYAKHLFIEYNGDTTSLFRDGWYDVYKLCNITSEKEQYWYNQCIKKYSQNLNLKDE